MFMLLFRVHYLIEILMDILWKILGALSEGLYQDFDDALGQIKMNSEEISPQTEWVEYYQKHYENVFSSAWEEVRPLQEKMFKTQSTVEQNY